MLLRCVFQKFTVVTEFPFSKNWVCDIPGLIYANVGQTLAQAMDNWSYAALFKYTLRDWRDYFSLTSSININPKHVLWGTIFKYII